VLTEVVFVIFSTNLILNVEVLLVFTQALSKEMSMLQVLLFIPVLYKLISNLFNYKVEAIF